MDNVFWDILCRMIGTKEQVNVRRKSRSFFELIKNIEILQSAFTLTFKDSGSCAEGLSLPESDVDSMYVEDAISVLPPTHPTCQQADLIMETKHLKPGFTFLRVTNNSRCMLADFRVLSDLVLVGSSCFLSSLLYRNTILNDCQNLNLSFVQHGPCSTYTSLDGVERDIAFCLSCKTWPGEATEWIQRYRPNNWPTRELIHDIVNDGCLLVPIGNPQSEWSHLEWRLSFSLAEKKLVYSINHTQILCYGFLKLFLIRYCESDILCSYFLKTCLFYSIEEDSVIWQKSSIINCLYSCFFRLQQYVREGYCPNYFIKANNMFEGKLNGQNQAQLLARLSFMCQNGLTTYISIFCSSFLYSNINTQACTRRNECHTDIEVYYCIRHNIKADRAQLGIVRMVNMLERFHATLPLDILLIRMYLYLYRLKLSLILYQYFVDSMTSNKKQYKRLKLIQNILHMCKGYDICTALLHYATLCYDTGQFSTVIRVVNYVLGKFRPYTLHHSIGRTSVYNSDAYLSEVCGRGLTYKQKFTQAVSHSYIVTPKLHMCPCDIETEVKLHSYEDVTFIPPVVYSNVLLFLSYTKLGDTELGRQILNELYTAAHSGRFVTDKERPLALALLAKCVQLHNGHH